MFLSLLSITPFILCNLLISSPLKQAYTITIPTHLDLSSSGSFNIALSENISSNEILNIDIDENFILSDSHGRGNITGYTSNNHISFTSEDSNEKTIYYTIENAKCGSYTGNLNLNISVETITLESILKSGNDLNSIFKSLNPTTITFSHDNIQGDYLYDLSSNQNESILLYKDGTNITITNNSSDLIIANSDMSNTFKGLNSLTSITNLNYLDTSNTVDMSYMFNNCSNLLTIDVSSFNTSACTNMTSMFDSISKCTSIGDISNWDVSNVTSFENFLYYDMALSNYGDLSKWKVSSACTTLKRMFADSSYTPGVSNSSKFISTLDLSGWDVSSVSDMSFMFANATNLSSLNISNWNTSSLTTMESMFDMSDSYNSSKLAYITGLQNLDVSKVSNMNRLFYKCTNMSNNGFENWHPSSLTTIAYGFYYCRNMNISGTEQWKQYFSSTPICTSCFGKNAGKYANSSVPSWSS